MIIRKKTTNPNIQDYIVEGFAGGDIEKTIDEAYKEAYGDNTIHSLDRFIKIQDEKIADRTRYELAFQGIVNSHKCGHWIWYIFPQLKGLGKSLNSSYYGLCDYEVNDYIDNEVLYNRLIEITEALLENDKSIEDIVGSIDALKIKSCITLFYLKTNNELFKKVLDKFYDGKYCEYTKERVE